jgi:hypothetical protein
VWNRTDVIQAWREQDGRFTGVTGEHIPRVTHWMPMPAPPTPLPPSAPPIPTMSW